MHHVQSPWTRPSPRRAGWPYLAFVALVTALVASLVPVASASPVVPAPAPAPAPAAPPVRASAAPAAHASPASPASRAAPPAAVTVQGNIPAGSPFVLADGSPDNTLRDLGVSTALNDGRRLWALGDTFEPLPAQSGVHPTTAAFTEPGAPGTFVEPRDANGHRYNFLPLTAAESAYNNGLMLQPTAPTRVADTRNAAGAAYPVDRPAGPVGPVGAWQQLALDFTSDGSPVLAEVAGTNTVLLHLTVFNQSPTTATEVRVTQPFVAPSTSALPVAGGETVSTVLPVTLGLGRQVLVQHTAGSLHVTVDLVGSFRNGTGGRFQPTSPTRIWDHDCDPGGALGTTTRTVQVTGNTCKDNAPVPSGATAVVVSLAAETPGTSTARLTLWRADQPEPVPPSGISTAADNMANLHLGAGDSRRVLAVVPLSGGGALKLANVGSGVTAGLDVVGYYGADPVNEVIPVAPITVCDTRTTASACPSGKVQAGTAKTFTIPSVQVPTGATSVVLNVTALNPALPAGVGWSTVSVVAGGAGDGGGAVVIGRSGTRAAMTVSRLSGSGSVSVRSSSGSVDVVIDVIGFTASRGALTDTCEPNDERPRIALWPTSMVTVRQRDRSGVLADRILIHYLDLVVCDIDLGYEIRHKGVAEYWYRSGQPAGTPVVATRLNSTLDLGMASRYDWGNGGIARDGYLYLYGCQATYPPPDDGSNGCSITRTPLPASATDVAFSRAGSYRYWNGSGFGTSSNPTTARPISMGGSTSPPLGQLPGSSFSVDRVPEWGAGGMYVMVHEPWPVVGTETVVIRTSASPQGPWSDPVNAPALVTVDDCVSGVKGCYTVRLNPATTSSTGLGVTYYQTASGTLRHATVPVTVT